MDKGYCQLVRHRTDAERTGKVSAGTGCGVQFRKALMLGLDPEDVEVDTSGIDTSYFGIVYAVYLLNIKVTATQSETLFPNIRF